MMLLPGGTDSRSATDAEVFLLLHTLRSGRRMGRARLGNEIGLNEGACRGLVAYLASWNMLKVEQTGVTITKYGIYFLNKVGISLVELDTDRYVIGSHTCGAKVASKGDKIGNGTELRDAAIRLGGEGCTSWTMRGNEVIMVPDWNVDQNDPAFADVIRNDIGLEEGDALVVAGAPDPLSAKKVAIGCALSLL